MMKSWRSARAAWSHVRSWMQTRRQPGQVLVLFALASIPLMGFVGLAIDGGNILAQRRIVQNGADSGAISGARDLARSASDPKATAHSYATTNAGLGTQANTPSTTSVETYINNSGTTGVSKDAAAGINVTVTKSFKTYFLSVINIPTYTVSAMAQGKVQSYAPSGGPFIVCGDKAAKVNSDGSTTNTAIVSDWSPPTIDSSQIGKEFAVHWPQMNDNDCDYYKNSGSAYNGVAYNDPSNVCTGFTPGQGCWMAGTTGTHAGPSRTAVAGLTGCNATDETGYDSCIVILPIMAPKNGAGNASNCPGTDPYSGNQKGMCVRLWAAFRLRSGANTPHPSGCNDAQCHIGTLLGSVVVTDISSGTVSDCTPPCTGPMVVRLSQ